VVEAVSGTSLDVYFRDNILDPLGMHDITFLLSEEQKSRRATPMLVSEEGGYVPFPVDLLGEQAEFLSGGGGLSGTGGDYLRFSRMILNGGTLDGAQILKPETVATMTRNQIGNIRAGKMDSVVPMFAVANDMFADMNPGWSYGFLVNPEQGPNGRAAGTLSWAGIANTYYWIDPVNDIAAVLMMQFLPFAHPIAWDVLGAFERAVYDSRG
jgi:methyl acetate hydrolase